MITMLTGSDCRFLRSPRILWPWTPSFLPSYSREGLLTTIAREEMTGDDWLPMAYKLEEISWESTLATVFAVCNVGGPITSLQST